MKPKGKTRYLKKIKNYEFYETIAGTVTRTVV